jgi:hypothetical protein
MTNNQHIVYCPNCGARNWLRANEKTRCNNVDCVVDLYFIDQPMEEGFKICVRHTYT